MLAGQQIVIESEPSLWQIIAALAGASAATIALYIGVVRGWVRRPSLTLHLRRWTNDTQIAEEWFTNGQFDTRGAYVRLRVKNRTRRNTAEDVEVLLVQVRDIEKKDNPDEPPEQIALGTQPLPWSNTLPTETRLHVAPGVERHVDLLHIREKEASTGMGKLIIDVHPPPADRRHVINPKKVEIELVASARNAKARRWRIIVTYDGRWGLDPWANLAPGEPVLQEWRVRRFMAGRGKRGYRTWPRKLRAWWRRKRAK